MRHIKFLAMLAAGSMIAVTAMVATAADRNGEAKFAMPGRETLYLSGPYTHDNLSIYIFYRSQSSEPPRRYLTLEEGLRRGLVKVTERSQERVGSLEITNNADLPVFLRMGQLLSGGKQDRTLSVSLVVPPHTQGLEIPAFCVEQSRWQGGKEFSDQGVIAPRSVREAVAANDQKQVWNEVREYKSQAAAGAARATGGDEAAPRSSSINEQLEGRQYRRAVGLYEDKLGAIIGRVDNPVGMAYAVGGRFSSADIYDSSELFRKLYPTLLRTAASEAMAGMRPRDSDPPTARQLADTILSAWSGKSTQTDLPGDNVLVRVRGGGMLASQLFYQRGLVHTEVINTQPVVRPRPPRIEPMPPPIRPTPPIIRPEPQKGEPGGPDDPWKAR